MTKAKRILLVEDCEDLRKSLASLLEKAGYFVTEARNGDVGEFLSLLSDFELVISDIRMPEIDGISMAKFIRNRSQVPIILITGFPDASVFAQAREAQATQLLTKPFEGAVLLEAVKKALND